MKKSLDLTWTPLKITLVYLILSVVYIVFSDRLILFITRDPSFLSRIQTTKGLLFVLSSALLIYFFIYKNKEELEKALKRETSLKTLLTQDMFSHIQVSTGYMDMFEDMDLPKKEREYLEKAVNANIEALDLIEEVRTVSEMKKFDGKEKIALMDMIRRAIKENRDILEGVDLKVNFNELKEKKIKGDSRVKNIFSNLLKLAIVTHDSDAIKIDGGPHRNRFTVVLENDGKRVSDEIKNELMKDYPYHGKTTGVGGLRFYILYRLLDYYDAEIKFKKSSLGGTKYKIHFPIS